MAYIVFKNMALLTNGQLSPSKVDKVVRVCVSVVPRLNGKVVQLIALNLCWALADLRGHVTDGKML